MGGLSIWHWLIVLVIVVLVFGTKRLKNVGRDLGEALRGFKKGLHEDDTPGEGTTGDGRLGDGRLDDGRADRTDQASTPADAAATPTEGKRSDDDRTPPPR